MTEQALAILTPTRTMILGELARDPAIKSAHSQRCYLYDLAAFEAWRAGRPLTRGLAQEYAAELQRQGRAPATINRALAAVRWWARRMGEAAQDDPRLTRTKRRDIHEQAQRVASVKNVKGARSQRGRAVSIGELSALLEACAGDPTPAGRRDAALLAVAWSTGLRRAELAGLELADYNAERGELRVRRGKGDKARRAWLATGAGEALADWLAVRGNEPGPLFLAIRKGGKLTGRGLSGEALAQLLEKRREIAGVAALGWHDLRRTFAGNLLDGGADLSAVQKLMGHASPVTTAVYDHRDAEAQRRAVRGLHVPYRREAKR